MLVEAAAHSARPAGFEPWGSSATGRSPTPAKAKTALPEPVIRLLPNTCSSVEAALATSALSASAAAWRSFRP
jgi:hypothetical protein